MFESAGGACSGEAPVVIGNPARPAGWVCSCGGQLDGLLVCELCQKAFHFVDGSIAAVR